MRDAHRITQEMILAIGEANGYATRRSFSAHLPSDAVWLRLDPVYKELPVAAFEVAVTEGPKALRGSITTLEQISPALGVLVLHDSELRRNLARKGFDAATIASRVSGRRRIAEEAAATSRQRIEIWSDSQVQHRYALATGNRTFRRAA